MTVKELVQGLRIIHTTVLGKVSCWAPGWALLLSLGWSRRSDGKHVRTKPRHFLTTSAHKSSCSSILGVRPRTGWHSQQDATVPSPPCSSTRRP